MQDCLSSIGVPVALKQPRKIGIKSSFTKPQDLTHYSDHAIWHAFEEQYFLTDAQLVCGDFMWHSVLGKIAKNIAKLQAIDWTFILVIFYLNMSMSDESRFLFMKPGRQSFLNISPWKTRTRLSYTVSTMATSMDKQSHTW